MTQEPTKIARSDFQQRRWPRRGGGQDARSNPGEECGQEGSVVTLTGQELNWLLVGCDLLYLC